jgi:hypothetical protein
MPKASPSRPPPRRARRHRDTNGGSITGPDDYTISARPIPLADAHLLAALLLATNDSRVRHLAAAGAIAVHPPDTALLPHALGHSLPDGWLSGGVTHH